MLGGDGHEFGGRSQRLFADCANIVHGMARVKRASIASRLDAADAWLPMQLFGMRFASCYPLFWCYNQRDAPTHKGTDSS